MYDVVIIGAGPAGLSAAIYAVRRGMKTLVITKEFGKRVQKAHKIDNYLGMPGVSGKEFMEKAVAHAKQAGVEILEEEVMDTEPGFKVITAPGAELETKSLIFATGIEDRKLGVPGEKEFLGKGVSYCATCDAPFFKDSKVYVVGNGNAAAHGALVLKGVTDEVCLVTQGSVLDVDPSLKAQLEKKKVDVIQGKIEKILGEKMVTGVMIDGEEQAADGVFIELGTTPTVNLAAKLGVLMDGRFITVNQKQETNVPGVYACGDIAGGILQMITAAGQGAIAALSAARFISEQD